MLDVHNRPSSVTLRRPIQSGSEEHLPIYHSPIINTQFLAATPDDSSRTYLPPSIGPRQFSLGVASNGSVSSMLARDHHWQGPTRAQGFDHPKPTYVSREDLTAEPPAMGESTREQGRVTLVPVPVSVCSDLRYKRREPKTAVYSSLKTIPAKNELPLRGTELGLGWAPYIHPEGFLYFKYKTCFTNVYIYDLKQLEDIEATLSLVLKLLKHHNLEPDDVEIGLDIYLDHEPNSGPVHYGCYYLCNRVSKQVFWLEDTKDEFFFEGEQHLRILGREHLEFAAESAYWQHVGMFPHGRNISKHILAELQSDLCYYIINKETAKTTTIPYTADDLSRFLQLVKDIEANPGGEARPQNIATIGMLKSILSRERFIRYHGEPFVQLDSDRNLHLESHRRDHSRWFSGTSCLFFFTPHIYLDRLRKIWFDNKVNYPNWRKFNRELQDDWTASITPSTVILSANVGFLAIQSVDEGGGTAATRTLGQIVSYTSILLSIGNIVTCTVLARQHRPSLHDHPEDIKAYLVPRASTSIELEQLAILLSIPTAFFLWALLSFSIAVSWVCFNGTSAITRIVVGVTISASAILVAGVVRNADWRPRKRNHDAHMKNVVKRLVKSDLGDGFAALYQRAMSLLPGNASILGRRSSSVHADHVEHELSNRESTGEELRRHSALQGTSRGRSFSQGGRPRLLRRPTA